MILWQRAVLRAVLKQAHVHTWALHKQACPATAAHKGGATGQPGTPRWASSSTSFPVHSPGETSPPPPPPHTHTPQPPAPHPTPTLSPKRTPLEKPPSNHMQYLRQATPCWTRAPRARSRPTSWSNMQRRCRRAATRPCPPAIAKRDERQGGGEEGGGGEALPTGSQTARLLRPTAGWQAGRADEYKGAAG